MSVLAIVGIILAVINPVIGGVLVGYLVWRTDPDAGFQIILLAITVFSLGVIAFIVWASRKIRRLERAVRAVEDKP